MTLTPLDPGSPSSPDDDGVPYPDRFAEAHARLVDARASVKVALERGQFAGTLGATHGVYAHEAGTALGHVQRAGKLCPFVKPRPDADGVTRIPVVTMFANDIAMMLGRLAQSLQAIRQGKMPFEAEPQVLQGASETLGIVTRMCLSASAIVGMQDAGNDLAGVLALLSGRAAHQTALNTWRTACLVELSGASPPPSAG